MRKIKQAVHIDFHTMPGIYDFGSRWDPEKFADTLQKAKVEYINAVAKCNLGFAYFPTQKGVSYPQMKGDMFGELLKECHKRNIGVSAYVNVGLDHEQARRHRDWCTVNKDGQVISGDRTGNFFRTLCYRSGYGEYILGLIGEVMDSYEVDGLFCDCMGLQVCHGNECLEDIKKAGLNPLEDKNILAHSEKVLLDISKSIQGIVGNQRNLYLNGVPYWLARDLNSHIEVECLPSAGDWGYDYVVPQMAYARNINKSMVYMTGRFQAEWGDFGGFKGKASLENDVWDALSYGASASIGDHMHPDGRLEPDIYKVVGEIYQNVKQLEPWIEGAEYVADIGVLTDSDGFLEDAYKGLSRMLGELKYSFDIVNEHMELSRYQLLILPDEMKVTPALQQKLEVHLRAGKGILSTGEGGLKTDGTGFALKQPGFSYEGMDPSNSPYFSLNSDIGIETPNLRMAVYCPGILMKPADGAENIAGYVGAYFNRHWDGFHGYFYTPPEKETEYSAVTCMNHICHICFKVFKAYYLYAMGAHKALIGHCISRLLPEPLLKCKGVPSTARVSVTETDRFLLLHVKTTFPEVRGRMNIIEEHATLPAGAVVSVRGEYLKGYSLPDMKPLVSEQSENYTHIVLPEVNGYTLIALEKQSLLK